MYHSHLRLSIHYVVQQDYRIVYDSFCSSYVCLRNQVPNLNVSILLTTTYRIDPTGPTYEAIAAASQEQPPSSENDQQESTSLNDQNLQKVKIW